MSDDSLSRFPPDLQQKLRQIEQSDVFKAGVRRLQEKTQQIAAAHPVYFQLIQDILTLLHVVSREDLYDLDEPERLRLLNRVASSLKLQETITLPGSVLMAMGDAKRPQPIRLGTTWITDEMGHKIDYQPVHLTLWELPQWLARKVRNLEDAPRPDKARPPHSPDPPLHELPMANQLIRRIEKVVTDQQCRILLLRHEGLSVVEIAAILHTTPNSVSVQLTRLKQKIAQMDLLEQKPAQ
jgi:DNA-binding CsgD family transcriptional regulator